MEHLDLRQAAPEISILSSAGDEICAATFEKYKVFFKSMIYLTFSCFDFTNKNLFQPNSIAI